MTTGTPIKAIPTRYAGHHFRSRLEARWAVFFDAAGIAWQYEPQGYQLPSGRYYLPDFYLPECATWIEVKGAEDQLDRDLMSEAAHIPRPGFKNVGEIGPALMVLGPMPPAAPGWGDWAWISLDDCYSCGHGGGLHTWWHTFGLFRKNKRPWWIDDWPDAEDAISTHPWLEPIRADETGIESAYTAARSARFEHGETPTVKTQPGRG